MPRTRRFSNAVGLVVVVVLAAVVAAGCGGSEGDASVAVPPLSVAASASSVPMPSSSRLLTARISLPATEIASGSRLSGVLVLTNPTGSPVSFLTRGGCRPGWAVGLENDEIRFNPAFGASCEPGPLVVPPGASELPFTMTTTYGGCVQDAASATADSPACSPTGETPPLPPGEYRAVLVSLAMDFPVPPPVAVRVVPA